MRDDLESDMSCVDRSRSSCRMGQPYGRRSPKAGAAGSNPAGGTIVMSQDIGNPRTYGFGGFVVFGFAWGW